MTFIEWVLNPDNKTRGITVNSKTGCLNHTPEGLCLGGMFPCYAFKLANGRLRTRYLANKNTVALSHFNDYPFLKQLVEATLPVGLVDPFYPRYWPERLEQIKKIKKPTGIFLDDMSDWMGDYWPEEWTEQELQVMRDCSQHRFYTLTKQPQNLSRWSPLPPNCYVGVTATNLERLIEAVGYLSQIEAKVKYVSIEPFLDWGAISYKALVALLQQLHLVIIGAQTKPTVYPKDKWVQEIEQAADKAGIPVFEKNNLYPAGFRHLLRQEIPG